MACHSDRCAQRIARLMCNARLMSQIARSRYCGSIPATCAAFAPLGGALLRTGFNSKGLC